MVAMGWQPARPGRDDVVWEAHAARRRARDEAGDRVRPDDGAGSDPAGSDTAGSDTAGPDAASSGHGAGSDDTTPTTRATRRLVASWHRASRARRTAVAATALGATAALVVGLGLTAAPAYREGLPGDGIAVTDLRHAPTASSWRIDPRRDLGIELDGSCLSYTDVGRVDGDTLVRTESSFVSGCDAPDDEGQRLARVDAATGRIRWSIDAAALLDVAPGGLTVWPQGGSHALVAVTGYGATDDLAGSYGVGFDDDPVDPQAAASGPANSAAYAELDLRTGRIGTVYGSTRESQDGIVAATDDIVLVKTESRRLIASSAAAGGTTATYSFAPPTYTVFEAGALDTPIWSAPVTDEAHPVVFGDQVVFLADGISYSLDLATRSFGPWGVDLPRFADGGVVDGVLLAFGAESTSGRVRLTAVAADGEQLWSRAFRQGRAPRLAAGCIVFSAPSGTDCVEAATGHVRWHRPAGAQAVAAPEALDDPVGSRRDVVFTNTYGSTSQVSDSGRSRDRALVALDGSSGTELFRAATPVESQVAAVGRTVGYALSAVTADGTYSQVTAFDLASGGRLWQLDADDRSYQFWGGSLVAIDDHGVVDGLGDPVEVATASTGAGPAATAGTASAATASTAGGSPGRPGQGAA